MFLFVWLLCVLVIFLICAFIELALIEIRLPSLSEKNKKQIIKKLEHKLLKIAKENNIPVFYNQDIGELSGEFTFFINRKTLKFSRPEKIKIKKSNNLMTLAHELGHYFYYKNIDNVIEKNKTEEEHKFLEDYADQIGAELVWDKCETAFERFVLFYKIKSYMSMKPKYKNEIEYFNTLSNQEIFDSIKQYKSLKNNWSINFLYIVYYIITKSELCFIKCNIKNPIQHIFKGV